MKTSTLPNSRITQHPISWFGLLACLLIFTTLHAAPDPGNTDQQIQLEAGGEEFSALQRPANRPEPRGLVLLLHGEQQHNDYPAVIATLRRQLADDGWHTLSLSMPEPPQVRGQADYSAYLDQALARIQAALDHIRDQHQIDRIYMMGHGLGGAAALAYLTREEGIPPVIKGFVGISLGNFVAETSDPRLSIRLGIERLQMPMLDVYAQGDRMEVSHYAKARRDAAKRNDKIEYRQLMLPAQDHQFHNYEALLAKRIYGWLETTERQLDAAEAKKPAPPKPQQPAAPAPMVPAPMMPDEQAPATMPMDMPAIPMDGEVPPPEGPGVIAPGEVPPPSGPGVMTPGGEPPPPPPPPAEEGNPTTRENLF